MVGTEPRRHWRRRERRSHSGRLCTTLCQPVVKAIRIVSTLSPVVPAFRSATIPRVSEWLDVAEGVVCGGRLPEAASQTRLVPRMMDMQHDTGGSNTHLRPWRSGTSPLGTERNHLLERARHQSAVHTLDNAGLKVGEWGGEDEGFVIAPGP